MSRLTRNGTAKSVSRNQILRRAREQGNFQVRWVCNSRDPVLCAQGTLTSQCGHNCLISYWYTAANIARFFFFRVFKEAI